MAQDSKQSKLGRAGESIVLNWYSEQGMKVKASIDQYDSHKDALIDGKWAEVKTQVPFVYRDSFTIKPNQLRKCQNVCRLIFVSVPNAKENHYSAGKVYCIFPEDGLQYNKYTTKDGRDMILIPIKQDGMREIFEMTEEEQKILQRYSVSSWN